MTYIATISISIERGWIDFMFNVLFCDTVEHVDFVCVVFNLGIGFNYAIHYCKQF